MADEQEVLDPQDEIEEDELEQDVQESGETEETTEETEDEGEKDAEYWQTQARRAVARAKKAEAKAKELETATKPKPKLKTNQEPVFTREEAILVAKGLDESDLDQLHFIAKGKDISLKDAQEDELFVAYQEKKQAEQKRAQAQLGASNGSGRTQQQGVKANMTAEEHKKLWREKMSS